MLTATDARFERFMEGWLIAPDAACTTHGFAYLEILEVTGVSSLTVKGDLTTMLAGDERFWSLRRGDRTPKHPLRVVSEHDVFDDPLQEPDPKNPRTGKD